MARALASLALLSAALLGAPNRPAEQSDLSLSTDREAQLSRAVRANPKNARAHFELGRFYLESKQTGRAQQALSRAVELHPAEPQLYLELVRAARIADPTTALAVATPFLRRIPPQAPVLAQTALLLARAGFYREAIIVYERVLRLHPSATGVRFDLALAHLRLQDPSSALRVLAHVTSQSERDAAFFALRAAAHHKLGRFQAAEADWRKALAERPDEPGYYYDYGLTLLAFRPPEEAHKLYRRALLRWPQDPRLLYGLGLTLFLMGHTNEAELWMQKAAELDPGSADFQIAIGDLYQAAGRYEQAADAYAKAAALEPNGASHRLRVAQAYLKAGRPEIAREQLRAAARLEPDNAEAHYQLAKIEEQEGKLTEAVARLKQAVALKPDYAEAHYQLGLLYRRLGQTALSDEAMKQFRLLKRKQASPAEGQSAR